MDTDERDGTGQARADGGHGMIDEVQSTTDP